jgi:prepilin-type N-terminal cleavage/methylation domain-containing protein
MLRKGQIGKRAFTLVEVLVVVAILAVLMALLLPAMQRARYLAKETVCMNNLRQVVVGLSAYATDHRGWYPKNGAYRNSATSLVNKSIWNYKTPMKPYYQDDFSVFVCPFTSVSNPSTTSESTYNLFFNTYGAPTSKGPIACNSSERLTQYDVNGRVVADGRSWSAAQTWYWPYLEENDVMRKMGDTWRATGSSNEYAVIAMDRCTGRGHPVKSRQTNHPDLSEEWFEDDSFWRGPKQWMPATSANYATTDGRVTRYAYVGHQYWVEKMPEPVDGIIGYIPQDFRR